MTPGKKASLQRSIRLHKGLPSEVLQYLRSWPRLAASMVIDNHYLMGTGGHSKERLSPRWAIAALEILKDENVRAEEFKNKICRSMRKARPFAVACPLQPPWSTRLCILPLAVSHLTEERRPFHNAFKFH